MTWSYNKNKTVFYAFYLFRMIIYILNGGIK